MPNFLIAFPIVFLASPSVIFSTLLQIQMFCSGLLADFLRRSQADYKVVSPFPTQHLPKLHPMKQEVPEGSPSKSSAIAALQPLGKHASGIECNGVIFWLLILMLKPGFGDAS